jgi:hypothetical protein
MLNVIVANRYGLFRQLGTAQELLCFGIIATSYTQPNFLAQPVFEREPSSSAPVRLSF